jgi:hypothetical protein
MPLTSQSHKPITREPLWARPFTYTHEFLPLAASAVQQRQSVNIEGNADFAVTGISVMADDLAAKLRFEVTPLAESFQFLPLYLANLGSGRRPFKFNPPIVLRRNCIFTGIADDRQTIAAANNIRIGYHGLKLYQNPLLPARRYDLGKPFTYIANFTSDDGGQGPVAANGVAIANLRVDGDSDFEVLKITIVSDGPCTFRPQSAGDVYWFQQELRSELFGGSTIETPDPSSGEYPFELPQPYVIPAGGFLATFVTDVSGFANRIQVAYTGVRLYPGGGYPR